MIFIVTSDISEIQSSNQTAKCARPDPSGQKHKSNEQQHYVAETTKQGNHDWPSLFDGHTQHGIMGRAQCPY